VRFLDEGVDDWKPLIAFLEKVQQNPQEHSRNQLFEWLTRQVFTITDDGDIIGYKSVKSDGAGGFTSISSGTALVNGEVKTGRIPQRVGDVVTMPRSEVAFDPSQGCSTGLHVANWDYASTWTSHDAVLAVAVNPRDVVSVPTDCDFQKVRVCRYTVIETVDHVKEALVYAYTDQADDRDYDDEDDYDDDDEYCDYCDEYGHDEYDCDVKEQDEEDEQAELDRQDAEDEAEVEAADKEYAEKSAVQDNPTVSTPLDPPPFTSLWQGIWGNLPPRKV